MHKASKESSRHQRGDNGAFVLRVNCEFLSTCLSAYDMNPPTLSNVLLSSDDVTISWNRELLSKGKEPKKKTKKKEQRKERIGMKDDASDNFGS